MRPRLLLPFIAAIVTATLTTGAAHAAPGPAFPRPGGGPRAIHALTSLSGDQTYLLDATAGRYRALPYTSVKISPDGRLVAVESAEGEIGVAARTALLRTGEAAVRWTSMPPGSMTGWSPDGRALLTTTLDKETRLFTAHRYDVATGLLSHTVIDLPCDTCTAGWAADSRRYVIRLRGADPEIPDGPAQLLDPDGTPGPLLGVNGHVWDAQAYSPTRRFVIVEPSRPAEPGPEWTMPRIFDLSTGRVVATIATRWPLLGWYDSRRIVRIAVAEGPTVLEVVDIHTGVVDKRIAAPGLPPAILQLGTGLLPEPSSDYGF